MNTFPSYPEYAPRGGYPTDRFEHEEKRSTEEFPNRIFEEPYNEPVPQSSAVSENTQNGKESKSNIKNQNPKNNIENKNNSNSNSNSDGSNRVVAVNSAVAPENLNKITNTNNVKSKLPTNNNKNTNTNSNSNNKTNNIPNNNATPTPEYAISNATAGNSNNKTNNIPNNNATATPEYAISNATAGNSNNNNNISTDEGLDNGYYSNNLLNVQDLNPNEFQPKPLTKSTLRAATATVTRTYTRTYTRTTIPTYTNSNVNRIPNSNINTNNNTNRISNNNNNNNNNNRNTNGNSQSINNNRISSQSGQSRQTSTQNTKIIPEVFNNRDPIGSAYNADTNDAQSVNTPGYITGLNNDDQDISNLDAAIVPGGADTGFHSTGSTIDQDINQIQTGSDNDKGGSSFSFVIILISIPIIIIICIASIFFLKKYKNGKRGSNIVYPDDKIRKSNLFGTLQLWKPNKPNRVSLSSGSHGSRTNLTNLSNNFTNLSNDRESNVPEYSEWLEAGSNTLSMPPVSPPPLVTEDKVNGLNGSNFAMGVNLDNQNNNNGTLTHINKPQAARMAWKLEGMRVGRDSTRKSERQSLFNSFQVW